MKAFLYICIFFSSEVNSFLVTPENDSNKSKINQESAQFTFSVAECKNNPEIKKEPGKHHQFII